MLDLRNAKYMDIGYKDKISQYVDFSYAYGNEAIIGFQGEAGNAFPITLIPKPIDYYVSKKYRILFVLEKRTDELKFETVLAEIKEGLFEQLYDDFPQELSELIAYKNVTNKNKC